VIATRRGATDGSGDRVAARERVLAETAQQIAALDPPRLEAVARSFSLYFQLVNLAEERDQARSAPPTSPSIAEAIAARAGAGGPLRPRHQSGPDRPSDRGPPADSPVALRRVGRLLERLDDPRSAR
jgi:hypothetical protein